MGWILAFVVIVSVVTIVGIMMDRLKRPSPPASVPFRPEQGSQWLPSPPLVRPSPSPPPAMSSTRTVA